MTNLEIGIKNTEALLLSPISKAHREQRQRRISPGLNNPNKTFYVVRFWNHGWGLFQARSHVMDRVAYAIRKNYIPFIDMKNYPITLLNNIGEEGIDNSWEYFFEQPFGQAYSMEDVYNSKNVILSEMFGRFYSPEMNGNAYNVMSKEQIMFWHKLCKQYCGFKSTFLEEASRLREELFGKQRILGVAYRKEFNEMARDKTRKRPHPLQASLETYFHDIEQYMKEWNCDKVFLVVDDYEVLDYFRKIFGDAIIRYERPLLRLVKDGKLMMMDSIESTNWMGANLAKDKNGNVNIRKWVSEYAIETLLLSMCTSLLAGISGNTQHALIINGGCYENVKIYDLGIANIW